MPNGLIPQKSLTRRRKDRQERNFQKMQRCLRPSCHANRQAAFGEFVTQEILAPVPHRHVVISLPRRLRPFFHKRCLRSHLPPADVENGVDDSPVLPSAPHSSLGFLLEHHQGALQHGFRGDDFQAAVVAVAGRVAVIVGRQAG